MASTVQTLQMVGQQRMIAKLSTLPENDSHPLYDTVTALSSSVTVKLMPLLQTRLGVSLVFSSCCSPTVQSGYTVIKNNKHITCCCS